MKGTLTYDLMTHRSQYEPNFFKNYEKCLSIIPFFWELWKVSSQLLLGSYVISPTVLNTTKLIEPAEAKSS